MAITTLVGTTWYFDEYADWSSCPHNISEGSGIGFQLDFVSNNKEYTYIDWDSSSQNHIYYEAGVFYGDDYATVYKDGEWDNEVYRTIEITGGDFATNQSFITWLQNNAEPVSNEFIVHYSSKYGTAKPDLIEEYTGRNFTAEDLSAPTGAPSKLTFDGWYYEGEKVDTTWETPPGGVEITLEAVWTIDTLAGTDWLIDSSIPTTSVDFTLNFTAEYNSDSYRRFRMYSSSLRYYYSSTSYRTAYQSSSWSQQGYRTVHITGGTSATNATAIRWFLDNATLIPPSYTVTFNANGHGTAPATQRVQEGGTASIPAEPTATGYDFLGWFTEQTCINEFDFNTPITSNRILYAKWEVHVNRYDVSFNMGGHGTQIPTQRVSEGNTATRPSDPAEDGWRFEGWYTSSSFGTEFDFETPITSNKTIYAKWTELQRYTVSFNLKGHGEPVQSQTVYEGETATRPPDPEEKGFEFRGWFTDSTCTNPFDFDTVITSDRTLYANWYEIPKVDWNGNRKNEEYIFKRVEWPNFQEHERYNYITKGSIELSTDADLKVTGSFDFEGYEIPDVNDLVRVYYSFMDDKGLEAYEALATFFVNYAGLDYVDTLNGIKASGTLDGSSVLKILQDKIIGMPYTVKKGENAVYTAENLIKEVELLTNLEPSGFTLSIDHTFDSGADYLEIVNWLLTTAGYAEAYPDGYGTIQLVSNQTIQNQDIKQSFVNNERSIMYPEIEEANDWQETPNVVRLLYNTDDACIVAEAANLTGSRASLDARGNREKTHFEEVSDVGDGSKVDLLKKLAEDTLKELSCDVEYVTFPHAYVPVNLLDLIEIKYSGMSWSGFADNISINLSTATKTQTKIKRTVYEDVIIESGAEVYRS